MPIITKHSETVGAVPLASNMQVGELAVNTADRLLYTENDSGEVVALSGAITKWTTAGRPTLTSTQRMVGYNTDLLSFEGWDGATWSGLGSAYYGQCVNLTAAQTIAGVKTFSSGVSLNNGTSDTPNVAFIDPTTNTTAWIDVAGEALRIATSYRNNAAIVPVYVNASNGTTILKLPSDGSVGTVAFCSSSVSVYLGQVVSGSSLLPAGIGANHNTFGTAKGFYGGALSGTWVSLGHATYTDSITRAYTLFQRIA